MVIRFALIFGIVYALIGVMGFIPAFVTQPEMTGELAEEMAAHTAHGRLLGLFPVNAWHNLVHLAVGLWGIVASRQGFNASVFYARANAVLFGALVILGVIPATNTLFGLAPIYGHDVWLHLLNALVAGYFGFGPPGRARPEPQRRAV